MRIPSKIYLSKFNILYICLFFSAFVELRYIPNYNIIRNICILLIVAILFFSLEKNKKFKMNIVYIILFLFVSLISISSILNYSLAKNHINSMIIFCVLIFELFIAFQYITSKNKFYDMISWFYFLLFVVLIVNDLLQFFFPVDIYSGAVYLIGDKFTVLYSHLILVSLYLVRARLKKNGIVIQRITLVPLLAWTLYMGFYLQSGSTLVCVLLFVALFFLLERKIEIFYNRYCVISVLILSALFTVGYQIVLNIPFMQYFITDVLGKTLLLSSRVTIYRLIPIVFSGHWLFGYGYGTSYQVWGDILGYGNAQNGLMDWVCQCGIFSVILILLLINYALKNINKVRYKSVLSAMLTIIYVLSIYATVEITIGIQFFAFIALLYSFSETYKSPSYT